MSCLTRLFSVLTCPVMAASLVHCVERFCALAGFLRRGCRTVMR